MAGGAIGDSLVAVNEWGGLGRGRWPIAGCVLVTIAVAATFFGIAAIGAQEAARNERVLGRLAPLIDLLARSATTTAAWLLVRGPLVGWTVTAIVAALAVAGLLLGGMRGAPVVVLGTSLAAATWGQTLVLTTQPALGSALYAVGAGAALLLGVWRPLHRLSPFRVGHSAAVSADPAAARPRWWWELALVVGLALGAMLTRTYALTELPQGFDLEMVDSIIASRTYYGLRGYIAYGLTANSTGIVHLLPKKLLFDLYGTSVYSLRLSAVIFGVMAVPLLYWFVRRLLGVGPALVAAVLLITAPEQLYWSRIENANFAPIAVLGLVTAHVGLWMVERLSFRSVLLAALWMPASRFFYAPGWNMFAYPLLLYGHAVLFVRGAWRTLWYGLPLLAGGLAGWVLSVSAVYSALGDWRWRFVDPTWIFGAPAWRMHGAFRDASWTELVWLQAGSMSDKVREVVAGMVYHDPRMFSQWFQRAVVRPDHLTVLNAGVAVLCVLGLAYLLGQIYDRRAWALLGWVGLGVLPAIMSDEPTTRRLTLMFPALYAVAAAFVAAAVRLLRTVGGNVLGTIGAILAGVALTTMAWMGAASHFGIGTGPVFAAPAIRFTQPLFDQTDLILHGLDPGIEKAVLLGNLDAFLAGRSCFQRVGQPQWLSAALFLPCDFESETHRSTMPPARRAELRERYAPRRVAFLLEDTAYTRPFIALLRQLYPGAPVETVSFSGGDRQLVSLRIIGDDARVLRAPVLETDASGAAAVVGTDVIEGVEVIQAPTPSNDVGEARAIVRGGFLLPDSGWYRFDARAACADASLMVDGEAVEPTRFTPMLAGVHRFDLTLPGPERCVRPLRILMASDRRPDAVPVPPEYFVGPAVAALPAVQVPRVGVDEGYGASRKFVDVHARAIDIGVDGQGRVTVLSQENDTWRVRRFDADGHAEADWSPAVPERRFVRGMAVGRDGTVVLTAETWVLIFDADGRKLAAWETPWDAIATDVALSARGDVLLAVPSRSAIAVFDRTGRLEGEVVAFEGEPGRFVQPFGLTVAPDGDMLVTQDDGRVLLFSAGADPLHPTLVRVFRAAFGGVPVEARGSAIDGRRLLIADPWTTALLVYDRDGQRLLAGDPARDLGTRGFGPIARFVAAPDRVYALESGRLWVVDR